LRQITCGVPASAPLARALLEWAEPHRAWLTGDEGDGTLEWADLAACTVVEQLCDNAPPHALALTARLAVLLALDPFDTALLALVAACDRLPRVTSLAKIASAHGHDLPSLLGVLAGADEHEADRAVRRSAVLKLGLAGFRANRIGEVEVDVCWTLERLLDRAPAQDDAMLDALVGARQAARLTIADFTHVADNDFLVRLLRGASAARACGVNILVHGPPGTGKTELARTLAEAAGLAVHGVGEADDDGEEPTRWDRVNALHLAQRVLARTSGAVLLFDEMEDLIGEAQPTGGDWYSKRQGSKVFVNRLLETNPVPVIWTTNAIGNVDPAILRRMSFVLKLDLPSRAAAARMLARVAAEEGVDSDAGLNRLLDVAPETATVLRVAARSARLAGEADGGLRSAEALVRALRGGEIAPAPQHGLDLDLFETDPPLAPLMHRLVAAGAEDVSLLLTGPPGTGKTALAHHLARALDRPLVVKRASDLLSRWVGGTESAIAEAFAEARERGSVLLFDEVDSLLFDRAAATTSWEAGQVNEMLTWLDHHPLPVLAATNHRHRLDPAALRRFVFKLDLQPLGRDRTARAYENFFGVPAPERLAELRGLTPGDFAVVARQLKHVPAEKGQDIVKLLRQEVDGRPEYGARIGF
ncbi:MAG TPA: AAA family ATPase, partial [Sphingomonas sp.]